MTDTPAVSVIVPFYNGASFAAPIAEMLRRQTFSDFELVAVNDGSTDDTSDRLHALTGAGLPFSVTVLDRENGGVASARNAGAAAARGRWLCFLDDDDEIPACFLSVLYRAATDKKTDLALGKVTRSGTDLYHGTKSDAETVRRDDFLRTYLYEGIGYSHCCALMARDLFDRAGGYPEGYRYSEDVFLLWTLIALCDRISVVPHALYYYAFNPASAMNKTMTADRTDAVRLMERLEPVMDRLAPAFAPEFRRYCVSRHYWSILWQAAGCFGSYAAFRDYLAVFPAMAEQMAKLSDYPDRKIRLTAALYRKSPRLYYRAMHLYVTKFKSRGSL